MTDEDHMGVIRYGSSIENIAIPLLCVFDIPPYFIPHDLLSFFQPCAQQIHTIKIFKSKDKNYENMFLALIRASSIESAKNIMNDFDGQPFSTLDLSETHCKIRPVMEIIYDFSSKSDMKENEEKNQQEHKDENDFYSEYFHFRKIAEIPILSPFSPNYNSNNNSGKSSIHSPHSGRTQNEDDSICPVCLESIDRVQPLSFSMYCGHTFHSACVEKLESPLCPVCRFEHDPGDSTLSVCSLCSSGEVSDLYENENEQSIVNRLPIPMSLNDRDIWVCLVCGFVGCGQSCSSHIYHHFLKCQHAYAMNTDTRHVWDFAGEGFVHRLAVQQCVSDDHSASDNETLKLFEVSNPRNNSSTRPSSAPLTQEKEELLIATELEEVARRHSTILARELENQREAHEAALGRLRHFMMSEVSLPTTSRANNVDNNSISSCDDRISVWVSRINTQLANEKTKAARALELSRLKLARAEEDLEESLAINSGLQENKEMLLKTEAEAKARLIDLEASNKNWVSTLEKKVATLMSKLES